MRPLSTERSPTYGALTRGLEQVELDDRRARVDDLVEPARHRLAGDRCRQPWTPDATSVWTALSWASASPPSGPVTWRSTLRSFAAALRAVDDLLDERVAQDVGDEPDLDGLGRPVLRSRRRGRRGLACRLGSGSRGRRGRAPPLRLQAANRIAAAAGNASHRRVVIPFLLCRCCSLGRVGASSLRHAAASSRSVRRSGLIRGPPRPAPVAHAGDGPAGPRRPR